MASVVREVLAAVEQAAAEIGVRGELYTAADWTEDLGLTEEAFDRLMEEVESRLGVVVDPEATHISTVGGLFCHLLRRVVEDRRERGMEVAA